MDLIIGGAYQGKLDHAKEKYGINEADIFECSEECGLDSSKRCIDHYELYLMHCYRSGKEPFMEFGDDTVVIMNDIFCGVVPVDKEIRGWREYCGRAAGELTRKAVHVTRIFCGLPQELK